MKYLDIENWKRKTHFYNFSKFHDPFFNICSNVEVTPLIRLKKEKGISFFKTSFFLALKTINETESFRYRIRGEKVVIHEVIHGSCTILNSDDTFSYCYFDYLSDFLDFSAQMEKVLELNRSSQSLDPRFDRDDIIHSSVIPWLSFNSFEHAKRLGKGDSIPKLVFGKFFKKRKKYKMPLSVSAHHGLMDGLHVGIFFNKYQSLINDARHILMEDTAKGTIKK